MAKKKINTSEEKNINTQDNINVDANITAGDASSSIEDEQKDVGINTTEYKYVIGDNVLVYGMGNRMYNGTGADVKETGRTVRRVAKIINGMTFPYEIGDGYGSTIGYFKEGSIQKLPNY